MMVVRENITDFDPMHIFDCGQCFRWSREVDGSYTGIAFGKIVNVALDGDKLIVENTTEAEFEALWRPYLDLDRDYGLIKKSLAADPVMAEAISRGQGIRILQQDKWEALISFIISQNSNIPRIKKCIESLCENFGEYAGEYRGRAYYDMPTAEILAHMTAEDLAPCRLGYRAKYIVETAKLVSADGGKTLAATGHMTVAEAREYLLSLSGVGPKVADCILLFSMGKWGSFPIDVWVKKAMNRLYRIEETDVKRMAAFAAETFGEYGGMAQQYLFYYMKEKKEE